LDYSIFYKVVGDSNYALLVDSLAGNTYTATVATYGFIVGSEYEFILKARNDVGLSLESNFVKVFIATTPDQPTNIVLVYSVDQDNIDVSWTAPDSGDNAITRYYIMI
jgi:hypothetical protein